MEKEIMPKNIQQSIAFSMLSALFDELEPLTENSNLSKSEAIARMAVDVLDDWRYR